MSEEFLSQIGRDSKRRVRNICSELGVEVVAGDALVLRGSWQELSTTKEALLQVCTHMRGRAEIKELHTPVILRIYDTGYIIFSQNFKMKWGKSDFLFYFIEDT